MKKKKEILQFKYDYIFNHATIIKKDTLIEIQKVYTLMNNGRFETYVDFVMLFQIPELITQVPMDAINFCTEKYN